MSAMSDWMRAVMAADQENALARAERARSGDGMTAAERAMAEPAPKKVWAAVGIDDGGTAVVVLCEDRDHAEHEKEKLKQSGPSPMRRVALVCSADPAAVVEAEWKPQALWARDARVPAMGEGEGGR